ncbi:MAG: phosphoribosylformylglycinamidine synthase subunit PurQ, partial [Candidatus Omnitrophota bacterium]|nr:phosphoribosylformylglycinamidine synthase subunit PurQ [Candidatus Omnitrophota bacterium]
GKLIIGICNGFQVLVKAGLLPGKSEHGEELEATLTTNDSARYEDRWVYLSMVKSFDLHAQEKCVWARDIGETIYIPAAHGEGKFVPKNKEVLDRLWMNGQVVFRYVDPHGKLAGFPWNPNGSVDNIAGICDATGRVFGLMPHPERHIFPTQHPRWSRGEARKEGDGVRIFKNGVDNV